MGAHLEVVLPIVAALYAGYQNQQQCAGPKAENVVAENLCAGFRQALDKGCDDLLSVPIGTTGIKLVSKYSVAPVQFPALVKKTISESYKACTAFWNGDIEVDEYRFQLVSKANVLNALFDALPVPKEKEKAALTAAIVTQGIRQEQAIDPAMVEKNAEAACEDTTPTLNQTTALCTRNHSATPEIAKASKEIATSTATLAASIEKLAGILALRREVVEQPPVKIIVRDKAMGQVDEEAIAEVGFKTGEFKLSRQQCETLVAQVRAKLDSRQDLRVVGFADARGTQPDNDILSLRRAFSTTECLVSANVVVGQSPRVSAQGILQTEKNDYARARRATIFARRREDIPLEKASLAPARNDMPALGELQQSSEQ